MTASTFRRDRTVAILATIALVLGTLLAIAPAAEAAQSPGGCTSNNWDISVASAQIVVVDGETVEYTVTVSNSGADACDISAAAITFTFPDGSTAPLTPGNACPGGQAGDCYPANGADVVFNLSYTANEAVDAVGGVASASVAGNAVLNRNPFGDEAANIDKNLALTYVHPAIDIVKDTAVPGPYPSGSDVVINITVTNTGDVELEDIVVDDDTHDVCDRTFTGADLTALFGNPWLPVGANVGYSCTVTNVTADVTDIATVVGSPVGHPTTVTDADDAFIEVLATTAPAPAIDIVKGPDQTIPSGDDANITITVTNTGDVDLENVVVDDDIHDECDTVIGNLAIGEVFTYTCTIPNVTASVTDTATVVGNPVGFPDDDVSDQDQAVITVQAILPATGLRTGEVLWLALGLLVVGLPLTRYRRRPRKYRA